MVTPLGIVTFVKPDLRKALSSILVTLSGITTLVNLQKFAKAELGIKVTPSGITRDVTSSSLRYNSLSEPPSDPP